VTSIDAADGRRPAFLVAGVLVMAITVLALLEGTARVFWKIQYGIVFSRPGTVLYALYPELREQFDRNDRLFRRERPVTILFLAGSALNREWSNVEQDLRERLAATMKRPVAIYNLATIGHTSRDSAAKYDALDSRRFDLVVFYHGINDARANNVPPDTFKADYSHYAWYAALDALEHHEHAVLALPYTVAFLTVRLQDTLGIVQYVPLHAPRPEWVAYGSDVKSAGSFETNLRHVVETAHRRGDPLLLMTFAIHVPPDYSPQAFNERRLDYTLHLSPIEMWGSPPNVVEAVRRHNAITRDVAQHDPAVRFVDQDARMPKGSRYFNDICHLTSAGSTAFVDNVLEVVVDTVSMRDRDPTR
jgi:hypothetical protein